MFGAFFLGLWLAFGLIILGIEFYYFIVSRYLEKDLSGLEALILIFCFAISIFMFIKSIFHEEMIILRLFSLLPLPLARGVIYTIGFTKEKVQQKIEEEKSLRDWLYTIEKQPDNVNAYVSIGDIYFEKKDYEKALEFYNKAYKIMEMPYILKRIRTSEKELKIQKGVIWVCPECSFDNLNEVKQCKICGYSKVDRNILRDIKHLKKEIFKGIAIIIFGPLVLIFLAALYIILPIYIALGITLLMIYFTIKYFVTY
ncbi:MAG: tetratricopeptide repeat protein [Candidatus Omnitrophica bacterium]|nr:tetratricopeptide repeat protein [Candidatus Omnitrophota bacterium]